MTTAPKHTPPPLEPDKLPGDVPTASAPTPPANRAETRGERLRRGAHQGRLQGYAVAIIALIAVLVALAATNTARVHVDWLVGSSRVSLVWLVLAAAILGWILGVLASVRFQWLTRARPHGVQSKTRSSERRRL
jgi:uncharacterized integral membrane protein